MAQPTIRTVDLSITVAAGVGEGVLVGDGVIEQLAFIVPNKTAPYAYNIVDRDNYPVDGRGGDGSDSQTALVGDRSVRSGAYCSDRNPFFILSPTGNGVYKIRAKLKEIL